MLGVFFLCSQFSTFQFSIFKRHVLCNQKDFEIRSSTIKSVSSVINFCEVVNCKFGITRLLVSGQSLE